MKYVIGASLSEPERASHRSVVNACILHTSHAQKFTLRTRKASHWLVVNVCVVLHARRSMIRKWNAPHTGVTCKKEYTTVTRGAACRPEKSASGTEGSMID